MFMWSLGPLHISLFAFKNARNYDSIVYFGSCRICVTNSIRFGWTGAARRPRSSSSSWNSLWRQGPSEENLEVQGSWNQAIAVVR